MGPLGNGSGFSSGPDSQSDCSDCAVTDTLTTCCLFTVTGNTVEEPDIHLILEYPSGASWGQYTARRANRFVKYSTVLLEG